MINLGRFFRITSEYLKINKSLSFVMRNVLCFAAPTEFDMRFRHLLGDVEAIIKPIPKWQLYIRFRVHLSCCNIRFEKRAVTTQKKKTAPHCCLSIAGWYAGKWLALFKKISLRIISFSLQCLFCDVWPTVFVFYWRCLFNLLSKLDMGHRLAKTFLLYLSLLIGKYL